MLKAAPQNEIRNKDFESYNQDIIPAVDIEDNPVRLALSPTTVQIGEVFPLYY